MKAATKALENTCRGSGSSVRLCGGVGVRVEVVGGECGATDLERLPEERREDSPDGHVERQVLAFRVGHHHREVRIT